MKREWNTNRGPECISVMTWMAGKGAGLGRPSVCEASFMGDHWYLNRVKVHRDDQGKGLGKGLLTRLQEALSERWALEQDRPDTHRLVVTPGGYSSNPADLEHFYQACGFKTLSPRPELLMEWSNQ